MELAYDIETLENTFGMGGVAELLGEVLAGPMLIMMAVSP